MSLTTLNQVADKIDLLSKNCTDKMIPVRDITFDNLDTVRIANEKFTMRHMAQQGFSYRLGIPMQYLKRCPSDIQAYNLNHWIRKEKNDQLLFRFDGNDVRVVFTPRYTPVDNFEILEKLDSLGYSPDTEVQCSVDQDFMMLSIPDGKKTFTINGNKMKPGITISNSEVGIAALSISAFILRLICTNGLISTEKESQKYKHISRRILDEFPEIMNKVSYHLTEQKDRIKLSLQSPVADPLSTLTSFNRQFLLGKDEQDAVTWAWPQEQGETMFHIVNTYTRASQFEGLPSESAYTLQKTGGNILSMVGGAN
jgi:hypothetical protein